MLTSQRKTPLQVKEREENTSEQWTPDVIHQGNFWD
jgi:hypothetical protein